MWSNVISIDKQYGRELEYILNKVAAIKELSYATEESKERVWIYLAAVCELSDRVESQIVSVLETVYLSYFKFRYFVENLHLNGLNKASAALVSSIVHFDTDFEKSILHHVLETSADYCVDGLFAFRLGALKDNWCELKELANNLLAAGGDDKDLFNVASFITSTEGNRGRVALKNNGLYNLSNGKKIEIVPLYDEAEMNLLDAVIHEHPTDIIVEDTALSADAVEALRHIGKVVTKINA